MTIHEMAASTVVDAVRELASEKAYERPPLLKMAQDGVRAIKKVTNEVGDGVSKFAAKSAEKARDGVSAVKSAKKAVNDGVLKFAVEHHNLITCASMAVRLAMILRLGQGTIQDCGPIDLEDIGAGVKEIVDFRKKYGKKALAMAGKGRDKLTKVLCDALEKKGVDANKEVGKYASNDQLTKRMAAMAAVYAAHETGIDVMGLAQDVSKEISEKKVVKALKRVGEKVKTFAKTNKAMIFMGDLAKSVVIAFEGANSQLGSQIYDDAGGLDVLESIGVDALDAAANLATEIAAPTVAVDEKKPEVAAAVALEGTGEKTCMRQALGSIRADGGGKAAPAVADMSKMVPKVI